MTGRMKDTEEDLSDAEFDAGNALDGATLALNSIQRQCERAIAKENEINATLEKVADSGDSEELEKTIRMSGKAEGRAKVLVAAYNAAYDEHQRLFKIWEASFAACDEVAKPVRRVHH